MRRSQNMLDVENVPPAELARRWAGSSDHFQDDGRKPWHSINFIVAHDGFTLRDLYSYNTRQNNQPYPKGPSDGGADHNRSWDQGGNPAAQRQAARTGLVLLMVSAGVPMITGGDEFYRTQFGNNNPYNIDNDANYLRPADAQANARHFNFTKKLIAFRLAHPALRPADFYTGADGNSNGLKDIAWLRENAHEPDLGYMQDPNNHFLAYRLDGSEFNDPAATIYFAYNGWKDTVTATLPANRPGKKWRCVADTAAWMEPADNINSPGNEEPLANRQYNLHGRSAIILIER
jgi:glycogen operon protein